jgi:hypothetical protein
MSGWHDDSADNDDRRKMLLPVGGSEVIEIVSWNGRYSTDTAVTFTPGFSGAFFVDRVDEETASRTRGPIASWPESVWFVTAGIDKLE